MCSGDGDGRVLIWDVVTGEVVSQLAGHQVGEMFVCLFVCFCENAILTLFVTQRVSFANVVGIRDIQISPVFALMVWW